MDSSKKTQVTVRQADIWAPLVDQHQQDNDSYLPTVRGQKRALSNICPESGTLPKAPTEWKVMKCILLQDTSVQHSSSCFTLQGFLRPGFRQSALNTGTFKIMHRQNCTLTAWRCYKIVDSLHLKKDQEKYKEITGSAPGNHFAT